MPEPVPGLPGNELVFKRPPSSRKYLLRRAATAMIFACLAVVVGETLQPHLLVIAGYLIALVAVGNAAAYALEGVFRTVVTNEGLEVRGYVHRMIPWSEVRAFRVRGLDQADLLPPDQSSGSELEPRRLVAGTGLRHAPQWDRPADRSSRTSTSRVTVEVVRTNGRRVVLPAPIVAGPDGDSEFADKVRQLEQWRQQSAGWQATPLA
jgi:hypothetical protein